MRLTPILRLSLVFIVLGGPLSLTSRLGGAENQPAANDAKIDWQPFSKERFESETKAGKTVLIWVHADWCMTCRLIQFRSMELDKVRAAIQLNRVTALKLDVTNEKDFPILESFKRFGNKIMVPELLLVGPHEAKVVEFQGVFEAKDLLAGLELVGPSKKPDGKSK